MRLYSLSLLLYSDYFYMLYITLRVIDFFTVYYTYEAQSCHAKLLFWNTLPSPLQLHINYDGIIAVYLRKAQWLYKNVG